MGARKNGVSVLGIKMMLGGNSCSCHTHDYSRKKKKLKKNPYFLIQRLSGIYGNVFWLLSQKKKKKPKGSILVLQLSLRIRYGFLPQKEAIQTFWIFLCLMVPWGMLHKNNVALLSRYTEKFPRHLRPMFKVSCFYSTFGLCASISAP